MPQVIAQRLLALDREQERNSKQIECVLLKVERWAIALELVIAQTVAYLLFRELAPVVCQDKDRGLVC
jgi:hypothetical protein